MACVSGRGFLGVVMLIVMMIPDSGAFGYSAPCLKNSLGAKRCLSLRPALRPVLSSFRATRAGDTRAVEEGAGDGGGAGVAVLTQPPDVKKATEIERKQAIEFKGNWKVLLHRDEWYTFDYCEGALLMIIPVLTRKKAHKITMEAHMKGQATVIITFKQLAREYSKALQKYGFTSSITPDRS